MEGIAEVLTLDNVIGIVFLVYIILQHQREKARSAAFFGVIRDFTRLLGDCQEDLTKVTPRN